MPRLRAGRRSHPARSRPGAGRRSGVARVDYRDAIDPGHRGRDQSTHLSTTRRIGPTTASARAALPDARVPLDGHRPRPHRPVPAGRHDRREPPTSVPATSSDEDPHPMAGAVRRGGLLDLDQSERSHLPRRRGKPAPLTRYCRKDGAVAAIARATTANTPNPTRSDENSAITPTSGAPRTKPM